MNNNLGHSLPILNAELLYSQTTIAFRSEVYIFFVVLEGTLKIKQDSEQFLLNTGDVFFDSHLSSGSATIYDKSTVLVVYISPSFISRHLPSYPLVFSVNSKIHEKKTCDNLVRLLLNISHNFLSNTPEYYSIMALYYNLLDTLQKDFTFIPTEYSKIDDKNTERIRSAATFVNLNYSLNITLTDMAEHLYISPQHCARFFRQYFQMTFLKYLNYIRLQHALDQLEHSDLSITQIAYQSGFPNLNSFNREFKKTKNITPNEFRKQCSVASETVISEKAVQETKNNRSNFAVALQHYEKYFTRHTYSENQPSIIEPLHLSVNQTNGSFPPRDSILNIGLLSNLLMHSFYMQLSNLQSELDYKYVRFNGVLDDEIISIVPDTSDYNYQNVHTLFDLFYELKLVPFIQIGNKPKIQAFAFSDMEEILDGTTSLPYLQNIEKLRPFLTHCISRFGVSNVERWFFEIWMDVDMFFYEKDTNDAIQTYLTHYAKCYDTIKSLLPNAKVGGPGFNTVVSTTILRNVLNKFEEARLTLDFFSFFLYPYEVGKDVEKNKSTSYKNIISGSEDILASRVRKVSKILLQTSYRNVPVYVSEYNFSISPRNHINDSCFQAAFILKTLIECGSDFISGFGYNCASDFSTDYKDVTQPLFGGTGLITKDNIKKPSFYSRYFFRFIEGTLIEKGKGYILTKSSNETYCLLLYHYVHPNSEYLLQVKDYSPQYHTDSFFPKAKEKSLHVRIKDLKNETYIIRKRFINKDYGNILSEWLSLKDAPFLKPDDISYLRNICVPHQSVKKVNVQDYALSLDITLQPHEVQLIEIALVTNL